MITGLLAIGLGYLLGSISPSYFLTKWLKGVDIRKLGDGNAGARNVYHSVGLVPAIITGLIDLSKGVGVILISSLFAPLIFSYLAGLAAVVGHIFPFYLKFRGGQGGATLSGILLFLFFNFVFKAKSLGLYFLFS
ncbi:MAG: glycerol-3-phosphate acyltransferase [Patescibacteria group bacterium]|nr:glycerol-3-phosphate acyltransferase [Patescibacteria group bacterium]